MPNPFGSSFHQAGASFHQGLEVGVCHFHPRRAKKACGYDRFLGIKLFDTQTKIVNSFCVKTGDIPFYGKKIHSLALNKSKFMNKIYSVMSITFLFFFGQITAQTIVTKEAKVETQTVSKKTGISTDATQSNAISIQSHEAAKKTVTEEPVKSTTVVNPNVQVKKITITKEQLDLQSDRGREYILSHPELYIVEEK
jgi:hypothetical protein